MRLTGRSFVTVVVVAAGLFASASAGAERLDLRYDPLLSGTLTGTGAALVVANGLFEREIAPDRCRWCDRGPSGQDTLNGFDSAARDLRLRDPFLVRRWGDIAIWRMLPQLCFGVLWLAAEQEGEADQGLIDGLIALEATVLTAIGTQVVRYLVARERPYVHYMAPEVRAATRLSADASSSFFSGHASVSFAMAVSAGTISTMRRSRWAPLVWVVGLSLASLAAYSRVAADLHYMSDVLTGTAFGSVMGVAIPLLLHSPTTSSQ